MLKREVVVYNYSFSWGPDILSDKLTALYSDGYAIVSSTHDTAHEALLLILDRPARVTRDFTKPHFNGDSRPLADWERELLTGVSGENAESVAVWENAQRQADFDRLVNFRRAETLMIENAHHRS